MYIYIYICCCLFLFIIILFRASLQVSLEVCSSEPTVLTFRLEIDCNFKALARSRWPWR